MSIEDIEIFGWKYRDTYNNCKIYSLGSSNIFESNGNIGIYHDNVFINCNMNINDIEEYTNIATKMNTINGHPNKYTYLEASDAYYKKLEFIKNMLKKIDYGIR